MAAAKPDDAVPQSGGQGETIVGGNDWTGHRGIQRLRSLARRPETSTELLQILKSVVAATAAWWISLNVLNSALPFLAPWTALLTVHATVYRSLSRGVQTTVSSAIGVALSFVIGNYLGVHLWTFALALFVGLVGARLSWIRDEGVAIATTAIFVLGSGFSDQEPLLLNRLVEVGLGVAIGVAVNLVVIPPLREQQAARYVDSINRRMGTVLESMADEFSASWDTDRADAWFDEAQAMSDELQSAWQTVKFARESRRGNPRRGIRRIAQWSKQGGGTTGKNHRPSYENILSRVDEGVSHLLHLTRTLQEGTYASGEWDEQFREGWVAIARDAGRAIADPDADVEPIADRLAELTAALSDDHSLPTSTWPIYGSLISSLNHIVTIVDDVASARYARDQ
ncbi:aromatic acid exporter family member 1 [Paramicrobacterium agarici]|uniref:Aromatic acid exporter family member 1 n=1 Tax=Paramicrobacterium agarici TaxID=630514 RepID=A0A2A9DWB6_9MICO|nr:aromatic acid exporter family member 1 [Microbacterium agarici]